MTGTPKGDRDGPAAGAPLADLARDWITLWQSELTAMAQDREMREAWTGLLALWAGSAAAAITSVETQTNAWARHDQDRHTAADAAPRAAADPAASDAGGDAIGHLHRRIGELEARLAALERGKPGDRT